jgi:hypothetical protein
MVYVQRTVSKSKSLQCSAGAGALSRKRRRKIKFNLVWFFVSLLSETATREIEMQPLPRGTLEIVSFLGKSSWLNKIEYFLDVARSYVWYKRIFFLLAKPTPT